MRGEVGIPKSMELLVRDASLQCLLVKPIQNGDATLLDSKQHMAIFFVPNVTVEWIRATNWLSAVEAIFFSLLFY